MAVQKSRKSRSRRGMRCAHDSLSKPTTSIDSKSLEVHIRHHVTASGFYRGKPVPRLLAAIKKRNETNEEE